MKQFFKTYKYAYLFSLIFTLVCFGFMLTHFTISIDEETWLLSNEGSNIWLFQGRLAVWLFNLIFTQGGNWAPFMWDFLSVILWHLSGMILAYGILPAGKLKQWQIFVFCAYFSSMPYVVGEVLSFSMFNLQVSIGMVAAALGTVFSLHYLKTKNRKTLLEAFLLLLFSFSVYQALICVYVTAVMAYFLIQYIQEKQEKQFRSIVTCALLCSAATILYFIINTIVGLCIGTEGYLTNNYTGWHSDNLLKQIVFSILNIARRSFAIPWKEENIYGGIVLRIVTICFVIYAIYKFIKARGLKEKALVFFYTAALCIAPFTLYLVLITYVTHGRMLLALPLAGAVELYLIFQELNREWIKRAALAFTAYLLFLNARNMNLIYYYGNVSYELDCATANQVMYDIKRNGIDYHGKAIAFVGMVVKDDVEEIDHSDTIGGSIFEWDGGNIIRMVDFLRAKGYDVEGADPAQLAEALQEIPSMNTWPQENSIRELDDVIVVYFSEPTEQWATVNHATLLQ